MPKSRILVALSAILLVSGTVFVAAEGSGPAPTQPGAEPRGAPKTVDPKGKNGGPDKGAPKEKAPAGDKGAQPRDKGEPKEKAPAPKEKAPATKEKAPPSKDKAPEPKDKAAPKADPKADKADPKAPKTGQKPTGTDKGGTQVTVQQRTEIRQTIIQQGNAPRVTNVNFNISVGTVVPRTIQVAVLPPRVIEIYPAWRGYRYFIVGDRIIIIDDGWRIVFIIEA